MGVSVIQINNFIQEADKLNISEYRIKEAGFSSKNSEKLIAGTELKNHFTLSVLLTVLFGEMVFFTLYSVIPVSHQKSKKGHPSGWPFLRVDLLQKAVGTS